MHKRITRLLFSGAAASLFLLPSVTDAAGAADGSIVIGQAIDLTGPNGSLGRDYVAGIKTCFDMVNSNGGINGRRIDYIVRDDRGQPQQAEKSVTELIEREQADYLLGGVGDASTKAVLAAPAFRRSGQALFAPLAEGDYPNDAHVLFWRPAYKQEIRHIFSHFGALGINSVGIAYQETPFNTDAYRSLSTAIRERHMTLAGTARLGADDARIAQEAQRLAAAKPGFVLVLADTIGTALFLKAYRHYDPQTFVAGTSLTNLATLRELAGASAVEWTVFSQVVPNPNAGTSLLQVEHLNMMRKYRDEAVSALTLEGFAAAKALVKAIRAKRSGYAALHDFFARGDGVDLGGLSAAVTGNGNRLSNYLDIALFNKGNGLVF